MKRLTFMQSLGLGTMGLVLPQKLLEQTSVKIYDNYIRGLQYYDVAKIQSALKEGAAITLQRDKNNIYDAFAVEVLYQNHKLGYLPAYENIVIANMLDAKVTVTAQISKLQLSREDAKHVAIAAFVDLITPTPQLLSELQNKRADQVVDIYRKGYTL